MKMLSYRGEPFEEKPQLFMRFPVGDSTEKAPEEISDGYRLRAYEDGDRKRFFELMEFGDFDPWDDEKWN